MINLIIILIALPLLSAVVARYITNKNLVYKVEATTSFLISWFLYLNTNRLESNIIKLGSLFSELNIKLDLITMLDSISILSVSILSTLYLLLSIFNKNQISQPLKGLSYLFIVSGNIISLCLFGLINIVMNVNRDKEVSYTSHTNVMGSVALMTFYFIGINENLLLSQFSNLSNIFISEQALSILYIALTLFICAIIFSFYKISVNKNLTDLVNYGPISYLIFLSILIIRLKPLLLSSSLFHKVWVTLLLIITLYNVAKSFLSNKISKRFSYIMIAQAIISIISLTMLPLGQGLIHLSSILIFWFIMEAVLLESKDQLLGRVKLEFAENPYVSIVIIAISLNIIMFPLSESYFFFNNLISTLFVLIDSIIIKVIVYLVIVLNTLSVFNFIFKYVSIQNKNINWSIINKKHFSIFVFTTVALIGLVFTNIPTYLSDSSSLWSSIYFLDDVRNTHISNQQSENLIILFNILILVTLVTLSWFNEYRKRHFSILINLDRFLNLVIDKVESSILSLVQVFVSLKDPAEVIKRTMDFSLLKTRSGSSVIINSLSDYFSNRKPNSLDATLVLIIVLLLVLMFTVLKGI